MRIESGYLKQDRLCGQKNNRNAVGNFSDAMNKVRESISNKVSTSGTWTLEQYEGQYRAAMYAAVKSANPNWKPGQKFDTSILDNVTRESVESTLVKNGNRLVRNSIDVSV